MHKLAAVVATALLASLATPASGTAGAEPGPIRSVGVTGSGVATYPAYDAALDRFAIRTDSSTGGSVTVHATTSDPAGTVTVNGRPAANDSDVTLDGLETGDEVNVAITDAAGTTSQSWIFLPADFPEITTTASGTGQAPGYVFLGLSSFLAPSSYEAIVDAHGVPIHVRGTLGQDLKASDVDATHYSVARPAPGGGTEIDELDPQLQVVATHRLADMAMSTDFHDAQLLPGGGALLIGYHDDTRDGADWTDAVIQILDGAGQVTFRWNSKEHVDPSEAFVSPHGDYAHINSVKLLANDDVLASFRNLGQVMRIATTAHDGFEPGDVLWRLGGKLGDFTFPDDPMGGPCAQHIARILPGTGHLMLFDNGSRYDGPGGLGGQTAAMCPDPSNPTGPRIARPQTRVTEYALDEQAHTASLVWSYQSPQRYSAFAGNHQRLPNGNTFIGWSYAVDATGSGAQQPIASEVTPAGEEIWTASASGWFSYRVFKYPAPDAIAPEIEISGLTDGEYYESGSTRVVDYSCTDRGGSNLQSCTGTVPSGSEFTTDGAPFTVTATDGAGNSTTETISYHSAIYDPAYTADLSIRKPGGHWHGARRIGRSADQKIGYLLRNAGDTATAYVRVSISIMPYAVPLRGGKGNEAFSVRYFHRGQEITGRMVSGRMTTPELDTRETWTLRIELRRTRHAAGGEHRTIRVLSTGYALGSNDEVAATVRAR